MAIASLHSVVLDCPDPRRLADFYAQVIGGEVDPDSGDDWVDVTGPDGHRLAFQASPGFVPPQWPSLEHAQQLHLDLTLPKERLEQAEKDVVELGARLVQGDEGVRNFRVYLDPAGHPFCLCFGSAHD